MSLVFSIGQIALKMMNSLRMLMGKCAKVLALKTILRAFRQRSTDLCVHKHFRVETIHLAPGTITPLASHTHTCALSSLPTVALRLKLKTLSLRIQSRQHFSITLIPPHVCFLCMGCVFVCVFVYKQIPCTFAYAIEDTRSSLTPV